jgi:hypothetical protein
VTPSTTFADFWLESWSEKWREKKIWRQVDFEVSLQVREPTIVKTLERVHCTYSTYFCVPMVQYKYHAYGTYTPGVLTGELVLYQVQPRYEALFWDNNRKYKNIQTINTFLYCFCLKISVSFLLLYL